MHLSVIIVNYNVKYFLEQCLHSVQKACLHLDAEIIVVDNNSTDGSRDFLTPLFPDVKFLWNSQNVGFAKANNLATANAEGEFILYLNPDTLVPEECFVKCLAFFEQNKSAGALGVKMIDGSGNFLKESKRAFPSPLTSLFKLSGLARLFPESKLFARYHMGHLSENDNHETDVLAGAFMMIRRKVLDEVGNFDEQFFMYGEDIDLSYRIQQAGYKNFYFAETPVIHFKGESTKRGSMNYVRLFYKAMSLFVKKHYSGTRAGIFTFLIQTGIFFRAVFTALGTLLKKTGLPILDAAIIFTSFWIIKFLWSTYIRQEINYSPNVIYIAFPVFTAIFLTAAYYSGLYDKGYKTSQLVKSTFFAALILLSVYALLPEKIRFSRGILIFGIMLSFMLLNIVRHLFIKWRYLETSNEGDERRQTIVVSGEKDFVAITMIMKNAGMPERVLGRVNVNAEESETAIGHIEQLPQLIKRYPVREIIFCENGLTYKEIINCVTIVKNAVRNKFHASGSNSIVGSDSRNYSGDYVARSKIYRIDKPINRRNKRLTDLLISIVFIAAFPVIVFVKKNIPGFYRNVLLVLMTKKTWIGYATDKNKLPELKRAVISSTSLPVDLNELPEESLLKTDSWYAASYSPFLDLKIIIRGFKYLDC